MYGRGPEDVAGIGGDGGKLTGFPVNAAVADH
jgi:hypothetical protein